MARPQLGVILIFVFSLILLGCNDKIEPGTTPPASGPKVKAAVAEACVSQQHLIYEAVATVQARTASKLSSKVMGTVLKVHVREGDFVKRNDVLVTLDSEQVSAQLRQAKAGLDEARKAEIAAKAARESALAGAAQALAAYERARKLFEGQAVTQENLEAAEARHKEAKAAVSQAEAMVEASQYRIKQAQAAVEAVTVSQKDTIILAPYDGKVTGKFVDEGDLASQGTPFLTLEGTGGYRVDLILPETYIGSAQVGQEVPVSIPAVSAQVFVGVIETIVPLADEKSRTFLLKVGLPGHDSLRPGLFARVSVPVGEEPVLLVPETAVVSQGQLTGIYVVKKSNVARFRLVRTGRIFAGGVEIVTGLAPGERFVVSPSPQVVDGAQIEMLSTS